LPDAIPPPFSISFRRSLSPVAFANAPAFVVLQLAKAQFSLKELNNMDNEMREHNARMLRNVADVTQTTQPMKS
jgi:hypothetical protein